MIRNILRLSVATLIVLFAGIHRAEAVPTDPRATRYVQSDGTVINVRATGDEFGHQVLSEDGYTLVGGPGNDYYFATLSKDGRLAPTTVKARPLSRLSAAERATVITLPKGLKPLVANPLSKMRTLQTANASRTMLLSSVGGITPPKRISENQTLNEVRSLVILCEFPELKFKTPNPVAAFKRLLSEEGYSVNKSTGSARDYYRQNSDNKFDPQFDIVGPFSVSQSAAYYAGVYGTDNCGELVEEVCKKAEASGVDFSQYAENGEIRDVFIFYAGYNQAERAPNTIWPHRGYLQEIWGINLMLSGAHLAAYACTSEFRGNGRVNTGVLAHIGTFCHEFGHVLGWPDFYDTRSDSHPNNVLSGPEEFSLMANGSYNNESRTPPSLSILERWMVGWAEPQEFATSGTYDLEPIHRNKGYIAPGRMPNEYFMIEFRGTGTAGTTSVWDSPEYIGGTGMIVYHVDYSPGFVSYWTLRNEVNAHPEKHEGYGLVRSVPGSINTPAQTFFPGITNVTSLLPTNNTDYNTWDKANDPLVLIDKITLEDTKMVLEVRRLGGPALSFKADVYESDAILTWQDDVSTSWDVTWRFSSNIAGEATVTTPELHIKDLLSGTQYQVDITGTGDNGEPWVQSFAITTQAQGDGRATLGFKQGVYSEGTPLLLTLMNYTNTAKDIAWYIDGTETTETYLTLPKGKHTVKAVITNSHGEKEYLIKYITIK